MRHSRFLLATIGLTLLAPIGLATDYAKRDREIKAAPAGLSKNARYALLVFGREAKLRVWLILDGKTLYLDRNGDGELTAKDERFAAIDEVKNIELADPDGETRYVITGIGGYEEGTPPRHHPMVNVDIKGTLSYRQYCDLNPADTAKEAPLAHFHGPLAAGPITLNWKLPPKFSLRAGDKPTELPALVGTMSAEHRCWVVIRSHEGEKPVFPPGVHPVVDIEFPSKAPGGPPIKKQFALDKVC